MRAQSATNETHSVRNFVEEAFGQVGLDWQVHVKYDTRYERPAEVELLKENPARAKQKLNWEPKVRFKELVQLMVEADLQLAEQEAGMKEYFAAKAAR